jgi:hypothetical protein
MAVYLSPGVYPREIDVSFLVTGFGQLRPALIGTANKGPINEPLFITNATQFVETFGEPFRESYLGYSTLAFFEEGNQAYIQRVGVEWEPGLPEELESIAIDSSGLKRYGWGRIPVFTGIDHGKCEIRVPTEENPISFHDAAINEIIYNDLDATSPTDATLDFTGAGLSDTYTGSVDDSFFILITDDPDPSSGSVMDGAEYRIVRNSDGETIGVGVIVESATPGESEPIDIGTGDDASGLTFKIVVTTGALAQNDSFTVTVQPNNRYFGFWVDREEDTSGPVINEYLMPIKTYDGVSAGGTVDDLVDDFNAIDMGSGALSLVEEYSMQNLGGVPTVVTDDPGQSLQMMPVAGGGEGWALEVGKSLYSWDIPRAKLLGTDVGPFTITSANNRVKINVVDGDTTTEVEFSVGVGTGLTPADVASFAHAGGVYNGSRYWRSYALQITDNNYIFVIEADPSNQLVTLEMLANFSNTRTLRFAEEVGIQFPYSDTYDGFTDPRRWMPAPGLLDPATPLSCEDDPLSDECAADSAYFEHIVGFFVSPSPGTWSAENLLTLEPFTAGPGDNAGRYNIIIQQDNGIVLETVENVSFDKTDDRYVANILNPGSTLGGINGNAYVHWEERPAALGNDENDETSFVVRQPSSMFNRPFVGGANGIPNDPIYSSELDRSVIGNPATGTGIFAFENPEVFDINLLATPGFSSGAVIGQAIQMCQSRGDVLYIVDPPFGLRPQQVVDWHNGMLLSDLRQAINSSYGALYWSWLEVFDQFSGDNIWIPPSGHVLAVFARTSRVAEQWFAPAGLRRGRLLTPIDVEYNATLPERDLLYGSGNAVNPIVNFPQDGITVWGQRTLQRTASALDRVNVRMLLSYIKKNLSRALRPFVFEQNDSITWNQARSLSESFLADIKARRGLEDFRVVCDETTNTPERRDRNEMWIAVFIKPTKVIEFIILNIVVMRSTQSFAAEEILAAGGVVNTTGV